LKQRKKKVRYMDIQSDEVLYEQIGPIARIWHNRPHASNAESTSLLVQLDAAVRRASEDSEVRVVIFGGKGKHFSAGHDLKDPIFKSFSVEERWEYEERYYYDYCLRIMDMKKPTIAQVQGACIAGGFMVANVCDLVVCSESAFFADPVVFSLGTASVEVLIHPYVMGVRKAKEFLFTGRRLSAQEASSIGMVNLVTSDERLEAETLMMAQRIAEAPPFALSIVKRSLNRVLEAQGQRVALQAHFDSHQVAHEAAFFKNIVNGSLETTIQQAKAIGE
jgi:enoyl-CoA hydratase